MQAINLIQNNIHEFAGLSIEDFYLSIPDLAYDDSGLRKELEVIRDDDSLLLKIVEDSGYGINESGVIVEDSGYGINESGVIVDEII